MVRKVRDAVVLRHPETGQPVVLLPGDDVPDWADITNEDALEPEKAARKPRGK